MSQASKWLIDGKVELRPGSDGKFDELVMFDKKGGSCLVHAEIMGDDTLWIGFYPLGEKERRVVMCIGARGKLRITTEEE